MSANKPMKIENYFNFLDKDRQTLLIDTIGKNNFFMNAFDSSGEAQAGLLSVRSNDEYREFITGIAKKLSLQSYETGDIICHKYEEGTEMYLIHEGLVGVFIETNSNDAALQRAKLESIYQIVRENASAEYDEHSLLKLLEYPRSKAILQNLRAYERDFPKLMALLSCFSQVSCWRPEQLHLLASDKIHLYLRDLCIYFWQVANKKPGDIIGEQALLSSTPRNATLVANGDVQLLTLDKQTFDEYMGIMIEKQQERLVFFQTCFPTMSKRTIQNFHCMFQKITRRRGDILHKKGDPASHLYLIEDGEIAIVNPNKLNGLSRVQINKLEVVVIIDKYALVGDELLLSNNYMFSAVCTGQPTRLYVLERSKLFGAEAILGKELMADLRAQMRSRVKYRAKRLEEVGLVTEQTHSGQPGQEMARLRKAEDSEPVKMFRPLLPKNWEARLEAVSYVSNCIASMPRRDKKPKYVSTADQSVAPRKPSPEPKSRVIECEFYKFSVSGSKTVHPTQPKMTRKHHFFNYLKNEYESSSQAPPRRGLPRSLSQAPSSPVPPYFASLAPRAPQLRPASIHLPPPQVPSDSRQSPDMSRNTSGLHTVSLKKTVGVSTGTSSKGLRRVLHSGKQEQRGAGQGQEGFGRSFHVASGVKRRKETGQLQMLTTTSFALKPKPDIQSSTIRQNLALTRNISIDGIMATKPRINMSKKAPSFFG